MTRAPIEYNIEPKSKEFKQDTVLDVPANIIPDQNKKKQTKLDSMITFNYLAQSVSNISFVLVIQQKHTKSNSQRLKNLLQSFLSFFTFHEDTLFQSTAMIITKAPALAKFDALSKRLCTAAEKIPGYGQIGKKWMQNLISRKALYFQGRFDSQQQIKKWTISNYKEITELQKYKIEKVNVCSVSKFAPELKQELYQYFKNVEQIMKTYINFISAILKEQKNVSDAMPILKQYGSISLSESQMIINQSSQDIENMQTKEMIDISFFDIVGLCKNLQTFRQKNVSQPDFFINIFTCLSQARVAPPSQKISIDLADRAYLYKRFFTEIQEVENQNDRVAVAKSVAIILKQLDYLKQEVQINIAKIKSYFKQQQNIQYYQLVKKSIKYFISDQSKTNIQARNLLIRCDMEIINLETPSKSLKQLLSLYEQLSRDDNSIPEAQNCLEKMIKILFQANKLKQALTIASKSSDPYWLILKMKNILESKQKCCQYKVQDFQPYFHFLKQIGLFQKHLQTCYLLGHYFRGIQERKFLSQYLIANQKIDTNYNDEIKNAFKYSPELFKLSQKETEMINNISEQLAKKQEQANAIK